LAEIGLGRGVQEDNSEECRDADCDQDDLAGDLDGLSHDLPSLLSHL
jgi:hypothetical protein